MRVPHEVAWQSKLIWVDCPLGLTLTTDPLGEVCLVSSPDGVVLGYAPLTPRQFRTVRRHLDLGGRVRCTVRDFQARLTAPWPVTVRIEPAEKLPVPISPLAVGGVTLGVLGLAALALGWPAVSMTLGASGLFLGATCICLATVRWG